MSENKGRGGFFHSPKLGADNPGGDAEVVDVAELEGLASVVFFFVRGSQVTRKRILIDVN